MRHGPAQGRRVAVRDIDVERFLIWVYREQNAARVAQIIDNRDAGWLAGGSNAGWLETYGLLGCHIDGGVGTGWLHEDAEAAHELLVAFSGEHADAAGLLVLNAIVGTRPDWMEGARHRLEGIKRRTDSGKIRRDRFGRERWQMIYDTNRHPIACRLEVHDRPESIDYARRRYDLWYQGLLWFRGAMEGSLARHRLTGPEVDAAPW